MCRTYARPTRKLKILITNRIVCIRDVNVNVKRCLLCRCAPTKNINEKMTACATNIIYIFLLLLTLFCSTSINYIYIDTYSISGYTYGDVAYQKPCVIVVLVSNATRYISHNSDAVYA